MIGGGLANYDAQRVCAMLDNSHVCFISSVGTTATVVDACVACDARMYVLCRMYVQCMCSTWEPREDESIDAPANE